MNQVAPVVNDRRVHKMICCCGNVINVTKPVDPNRKYNYLCNACSRLSEDLMYHIFERPTNVVERRVIEVTYYVLFNGHDGTCRFNNGTIVTERLIQTHQFFLSDKLSNFITWDAKIAGGPLNLYRKMDEVCECQKSTRRFTIIDATVKEGYIVLINHGMPISTRRVTDPTEIKRLERIDLCKQLLL
jgi:hypothetical protein